MPPLSAILEAAVLASSLSADAFTAGFAYGSKRITIPLLSLQIINLICSSITGLSLLAGTILKPYLSDRLASGIAFGVLFVIGLVKLLDGVTKSFIRTHSDLRKEIQLSVLNFRFILSLYADPEAADVDVSKTLSPMEASALALSLSLDGIAVGFGAALANVSSPAVFLWSFVTNAIALLTGCRIGNTLAEKLPFNISWMSGIVLIGLAISKLR